MSLLFGLNLGAMFPDVLTDCSLFTPSGKLGVSVHSCSKILVEEIFKKERKMLQMLQLHHLVSQRKPSVFVQVCVSVFLYASGNLTTPNRGHCGSQWLECTHTHTHTHTLIRKDMSNKVTWWLSKFLPHTLIPSIFSPLPLTHTVYTPSYWYTRN